MTALRVITIGAKIRDAASARFADRLLERDPCQEGSRWSVHGCTRPDCGCDCRRYSRLAP